MQIQLKPVEYFAEVYSLLCARCAGGSGITPEKIKGERVGGDRVDVRNERGLYHRTANGRFWFQNQNATGRNDNKKQVNK